MALYTVTTGNTILAQDVNQAVGALQKASGATESGTYQVSQNAYTSGALVTQWFSSLSRNATPVSVSFDTSSTSPNTNTPASAKLSANGFQLNATATGATLNGKYGGNWTIQY